MLSDSGESPVLPLQTLQFYQRREAYLLLDGCLGSFTSEMKFEDSAVWICSSLTKSGLRMSIWVSQSFQHLNPQCGRSTSTGRISIKFQLAEQHKMWSISISGWPRTCKVWSKIPHFLLLVQIVIIFTIPVYCTVLPQQPMYQLLARC